MTPTVDRPEPACNRLGAATESEPHAMSTTSATIIREGSEASRIWRLLIDGTYVGTYETCTQAKREAGQKGAGEVTIYMSRYAAEKSDQGPDWYIRDRQTGRVVGDARSQYEAREKARELSR